MKPTTIICPTCKSTEHAVRINGMHFECYCKDCFGHIKFVTKQDAEFFVHIRKYSKQLGIK